MGIWDIADVITKYSDEVEFQVMSIEKLQSCVAYQEYSSLVEIFGDFRESRDSKFDERQLHILRNLKEQESDAASTASSSSSSSSSSSVSSISISASLSSFAGGTSRVMEPDFKKFDSEILITETPTTMDILFSCGPGNSLLNFPKRENSLLLL